MKTFKVCFIGVGSIAKRHIKNLNSICVEDKVDLIVDAVRRNGCSEEERLSLGLCKVYKNVTDIKEIYDAVFITNPTEFHIDTLKVVQPYSKHFFIEKPISSIHQLASAENFKMKESAIYYVACPLRYHAVIQYIKDNIELDRVVSVRCISSSYLPDWRPGIDYRDTYSAHKNLGGGVSIDLIHEWDYITYLFGMPDKVKCFIGKKSKLELDSEDYAIYIAEYNKMIAELHLDYFGRNTIREIQLFTEDDTIVGDLVNHRILYRNEGKEIDLHEERDDYQKRELRHFIDLIEDGIKHEELSHAISVLKLSQGVLA